MNRKGQYYKEKTDRKSQQRNRHKNIGLLVILITAIVAVFICSGLSTYAQAKDTEQEYKYYTSVRIAEGDTLWEVAVSNYNENHDTVTSFIDEVCQINGLTEDSVIFEGMNIIIPYYSRELK